MDFTDYQEFFKIVRGINEKYMKPADENYKILEEYGGKNVPKFVQKLKNAYEILIKAIEPGDILSSKKTVKEHLNEYTNYLQIFLILTYINLINAREKDLYESINEDDATMIKVKIKPEKAELSKFVQLSKGKKDQEKTDVLDTAIKCSKNIYDFVEASCAKHHLL
jgi:hypothetical protein